MKKNNILLANEGFSLIGLILIIAILGTVGTLYLNSRFTLNEEGNYENKEIEMSKTVRDEEIINRMKAAYPYVKNKKDALDEKTTIDDLLEYSGLKEEDLTMQSKEYIGEKFKINSSGELEVPLKKEDK